MRIRAAGIFPLLLVCLLVLGPGEAGATETSALNLKTALFAGRCFWCMEPPFEKLDGVEAVISGYTVGYKANPTYKEVSAGITGHAEAVQIRYHPEKINYQKLLEVFWRKEHGAGSQKRQNRLVASNLGRRCMVFGPAAV